MNSLLVAANVVTPLLILIAIGYTAGSLKWISNDSFTQLNKLVFNVLLPCVLFSNVYSASIDEIANPRLLLLVILSILAIFFIGIPISGMLTREPQKRGVVLQNMFRSNFVFYGLPIVQSIYVNDSMGAMSVLIALLLPIFNILAVISLEMFRSGKVEISKILLNIAKNPMIISTAIGILCSAAAVDLPYVLRSTLSTITAATTPVALIILGGTFIRQTLKVNMKLLVWMAMLRLLMVPAIFLSISVLFGFRDIELLMLLALYCSPVAVSSFSMAQQMGADGELAGQNLVATSVFSIISIFIWVSLLNYFAFIT